MSPILHPGVEVTVPVVHVLLHGFHLHHLRQVQRLGLRPWRLESEAAAGTSPHGTRTSTQPLAVSACHSSNATFVGRGWMHSYFECCTSVTCKHQNVE